MFNTFEILQAKLQRINNFMLNCKLQVLWRFNITVRFQKKLSASSTSPNCSWTFLNIRLNVKNVFVFIFFFTTANFSWFQWNEQNLLQNNGLQLIKEIDSLILSSNYRQITLWSWLLNYGNKKHFFKLDSNKTI